MTNYPIGIFDSGIGGLTIANALKKSLPNESIIYYGDTKHLPYGEKSSLAIQKFCIEITEFLIKKNCKAIIIACNSASSVAYKKVKKIAKNIPVYSAVDPVVGFICSEVHEKKIGIIGTKATIKSEIYEKKIMNLCSAAKVSALATPLLAPMIEEGFINGDISNTIITNYLANEKLTNINYLILACTHYPLIFDEIKRFYFEKSVTVINSAKIISKFISKDLNHKNLLNDMKNANYSFYVSNFTESFEKSAKFFFEEDIKLEEIDIF